MPQNITTNIKSRFPHLDITCRKDDDRWVIQCNITRHDWDETWEDTYYFYLKELDNAFTFDCTSWTGPRSRTHAFGYHYDVVVTPWILTEEKVEKLICREIGLY